jgi:hypothetical protein
MELKPGPSDIVEYSRDDFISPDVVAKRVLGWRGNAG